MDDLMKALQAYLEKIISKHVYCPHCMGMLPRHYDDCQLGKLLVEFAKVKNGNNN